MIIRDILGHRSDVEPAELQALQEDRVSLTNAQLRKRVQRVTTESGEEIGLQFAKVPELRDGDVLYRDDKRIITVRATPTDVLVISPSDALEMGIVAHTLGNRHLQAQFFGPDSEYGRTVMVVLYDHTVEDFLKHSKTPYARENRIMPVPFRHAEHTH